MPNSDNGLIARLGKGRAAPVVAAETGWKHSDTQPCTRHSPASILAWDNAQVHRRVCITQSSDPGVRLTIRIGFVPAELPPERQAAIWAGVAGLVEAILDSPAERDEFLREIQAAREKGA